MGKSRGKATAVEFDSLAASAAAALGIAVGAVRKLEAADAGPLFNSVVALPRWLDDAPGWHEGLWRALRETRPEDAEAAWDALPEAAGLFRRVCSNAVVTAAPDASLLARHRHLVLASVYAGALSRLAYGGKELEAAVSAVVSRKAAAAARSRGSVKAMAKARAQFNEWKAGKMTFRSNTAFATWACEQCGLASVQHLAREVGKWERERRAAAAKRRSARARSSANA